MAWSGTTANGPGRHDIGAALRPTGPFSLVGCAPPRLSDAAARRYSGRIARGRAAGAMPVGCLKVDVLHISAEC